MHKTHLLVCMYDYTPGAQNGRSASTLRNIDQREFSLAQTEVRKTHVRNVNKAANTML